jgi:hypothetical protein
VIFFTHHPFLFFSSNIIALRVGDGVSAFADRQAYALYFDEINPATGAIVQSVPVPTTGMYNGPSVNPSNLACTLSVGHYFSATWDQGATPFTYTFGGRSAGTYSASGYSAAIPGYSASFNGNGEYPLWFFDREGLPTTSYDGRYISVLCKNVMPGGMFQRGGFFNDTGGYTSSGYDDKVILRMDWKGNIDTTTRLAGNQFYYGPLIPDEPQYDVSAITSGQNVGASPPNYFASNSGDNGEGVDRIPHGSQNATKGANRITNTPGYYDSGALGFGTSGGPFPTSTTPGAEPVIFITSPSVLNAGATDIQHWSYRGLNVMTPTFAQTGSVGFSPLAGFQNFVGAPFQFAFDTPTSVWIADAGVSLVDKTVCQIQHWSTTGSVLSGMWSMNGTTVVIDSTTPCYSMFGRWESGNTQWVLYLTTSSKTSSKIYKYNTATGTTTIVKSAVSNVVYRGVAMPPLPRSVTCPAGSFLTSTTDSCAYNCCSPCTLASQCPSYAPHFVETCSSTSDNTCMNDAQYQAYMNSITPTPSPSVGSSTSPSVSPVPTVTPTPSISPSPTPTPSASPSFVPPRFSIK